MQSRASCLSKRTQEMKAQHEFELPEPDKPMRCKVCEREAYPEELTVDGFCSAKCEEAWHRAHDE